MGRYEEGRSTPCLESQGDDKKEGVRSNQDSGRWRWGHQGTLRTEETSETTTGVSPDVAEHVPDKVLRESTEDGGV